MIVHTFLNLCAFINQQCGLLNTHDAYRSASLFVANKHICLPPELIGLYMYRYFLIKV